MQIIIEENVQSQSIAIPITRKRQVTYQVMMRGSDGFVMASDKRELLEPNKLAGDEGSGSVINMVCKIRFDQTRRFAWAFAGAKPSLLAASYLEREFEYGIAEEALQRTLRDCGDRGWEQGASGPSNSTVVLVDGKTKRIWRATLAHKSTVVMEIEDGRCLAGQTYNKASFFPERFYSPDMSVEQLSKLAAYAIVMAGKMDSLCVAGLDVAVYRDSVGRFEFVDRNFYSGWATQADEEIRKLFQSPKR